MGVMLAALKEFPILLEKEKVLVEERVVSPKVQIQNN
jgi:hypothetical protein